MVDRSRILRAAALLAAVPAAAHAEFEVSGYLKNETAAFVKDGFTTGQKRVFAETPTNGGNAGPNDAGDIMKFENTVKLFLNADVGSSASWHGELNFITNTPDMLNSTYDALGYPSTDLKGHLNYTQHDFLREFYFDVPVGDWDLRLGKQQVVWGTADGIKLLDIINPTDFRELNQNTTEDARIPVWMINANTLVGDTGDIQLILSQSESHFIPGLNGNQDIGAPFKFLGVDSISGPVNGFFGIAPALGAVASTFTQYSAPFGAGGLNQPGIGNTRVQDFIDGNTAATQAGSLFALACGTVGIAPNTPGIDNTNAACLNAIAQSVGNVPWFGNQVSLGGNDQVTNEIDGGDPIGTPGGTPVVPTAADTQFWNTAVPNSAFEYFPDAAFGTFDTFVNLNTEYRVDNPDPEDPNFGFRYRAYTSGGTNWSVNYLYAYDPNPSVSIHYEAPDGTRLNPDFVSAGFAANLPENVVILRDAQGNQRCSAQAGIDVVTGPAGDGCTLVFEQTMERSHFLGGSFDTAVDNIGVPLIIRGEFLYQKDARVPVIDRGQLALGNLTEGLKSEKADFFKYVLGFDFTFFTNLFFSTQLIQFWNLDYVDESSSQNDRINAARAFNGVTEQANYQRYTGDPSTLHLSNDLNKGDEYETFVSAFFSKPFGPSQEHRWNNILIWENGDGFWNRFDVEYSFHDTLIGLAEINYYFGEEDTLFGQMENASNVQLGVKWLFQ